MPKLVYYKDRNGTVKGPLSEEEATALFKSNFFRPDHVFRIVDANNPEEFSSIDYLRSLNGEETPFGNNAEEKEQKELMNMMSRSPSISPIAKKRRIDGNNQDLTSANESRDDNDAQIKKIYELELDNVNLKKRLEEETSLRNELERSFMDFPIEIIEKIFSYLDVPTRLKLRLNSQLDDIQLSTRNNLESIKLDVRHGIVVDIISLNGSLSRFFHDCSKLERGFRRLALNTNVNDISLYVNGESAKNPGFPAIFDEILKFVADKFDLCDRTSWTVSNFPVFDRSHLFSLSLNVREVDISIVCTSLTTSDLRSIRKNMLDRSCKMERFSVLIMMKIGNRMLKTCFGVTVENKYDDFDDDYLGRQFQATDESVELYSSFPGGDTFHHYEGDLESIFKRKRDLPIVYKVSFVLHESDPKPDSDDDLIQYNHFYPDE